MDEQNPFEIWRQKAVFLTQSFFGLPLRFSVYTAIFLESASAYLLFKRAMSPEQDDELFASLDRVQQCTMRTTMIIVGLFRIELAILLTMAYMNYNYFFYYPWFLLTFVEVVIVTLNLFREVSVSHIVDILSLAFTVYLMVTVRSYFRHNYYDTQF